MSKSIARLKKSLAAYDRPHGTTQRYWQGCRCVQCRAAHANRIMKNKRERDAGRPLNNVISTDEARKHLRLLRKRSVGLRAVEIETGINARVLFDVRIGRKKNMRAGSVRKILEVKSHMVSDGAKIPIQRTLKLVKKLKREGFTVQGIGHRLGVKDLKFGKTITAKRAMEIEKFFNRVMAA